MTRIDNRPTHAPSTEAKRTTNPLHIAYAREELARLNKLRAIYRAHVQEGKSQTAIAKDAGLSQAEVSRIVKRVGIAPHMLDVSPTEIVLQFVAGDIEHHDMMEKLTHWPYSFARDAEPENPLTVRTSGSWDEVTDAMHRGLVDYDDYDYLLECVRPPSA